MIKVENLSKSYGNLKALNNVSFNINEGEIFGFLGPNGAGKSTTIQILSSLLNSYSGNVYINGKQLSTSISDCKKIIGVVPQEISLYEDFSAYDNLLFWGKLYGVPTRKLKQRINDILELIGLSDRKTDLVKTYSGGMKRRINIAAALLHDPKILFMDEPTTGVDPQSRNRIFEIIETLNKKGITIIYTTHYMEEVERLCNKIAIIDSGKIVAQGTRKELQNLCHTNEFVTLELESITATQAQKLQDSSALKISQKSLNLTIECKPNKDLSGILSTCNLLEIPIKNIAIHKTNLESIFLQLTGKQLRD